MVDFVPFFLFNKKKKREQLTQLLPFEKLNKNLNTSNTYIDVLLGALVSSSKVWSIRISLKEKKKEKGHSQSLLN